MDPKILTILRMSGLERVADLIESDGLTAEGVSVHYLLGKGISAEEAVKAVTIIEMTRQPGAPAGEAPAGRPPDASATPASPPTGAKPPQGVGVTCLGVFCWLLTLPAIAMLCGGETQFTCSIPTVFAVILISILNLRKAETQGLKIFVGLPIPVSGLIYISSAIASIGSASSYKEKETALGFLSATIFWGGISLLVLKHAAVKEKLSRVTAPIRTAMAKARDRFAALSRRTLGVGCAAAVLFVTGTIAMKLIPRPAGVQCDNVAQSVEVGEIYEFQCMAIDQFDDVMTEEKVYISSENERFIIADEGGENGNSRCCSIRSREVGRDSVSIWTNGLLGRSEWAQFSINTVPRANFEVISSHLSSKGYTARCTIRNTDKGNPSTGHVRITVAHYMRGEDITLNPMETKTIEIEFPEYIGVEKTFKFVGADPDEEPTKYMAAWEPWENNHAVCSVEHNPSARLEEQEVTSKNEAANQERIQRNKEELEEENRKQNTICIWECNKDRCDNGPFLGYSRFQTHIKRSCYWSQPLWGGWLCISGPCQ